MSSLLWQRIARDITSDVNGVKTTYSSWDTCMQKSYCKWVGNHVPSSLLAVD